MVFEIKDRAAAGRLCRYKTAHGTITTPTLLPVINPNKMIITPKEMKQNIGVQSVITNSYIISKHTDLKEQALDKGVHDLIDFTGPIMTDSGTFQTYVYGDRKIDPIDIVCFQRDIGSDIGTILDVFGTPYQTKQQAAQGVQQTIQRAKESISHKGSMRLAATVQGSVYPDLRKQCAQELSKLHADFYPIGGVVPLMENQRYTDLVHVIIAAKQGLDPSKPVHLFGAGHPLLFPLAVALGCDFFDSAAYIKYAEDKRLIFPWGTEKLDTLTELPCFCPICTQTTAKELQKTEHIQQIRQLALHNLYISIAELKTIRNAIKQGCLWELVERRATANPYLSAALRELRKKQYKNWLEEQEPTSKPKAVMYTGTHTIHRPIFHRLHTRLLTRYHPRTPHTLLLEEATKPYGKTYHDVIQTYQNNYSILVQSHFGPVPIELDELYPIAQSVSSPIPDDETQKTALRITQNFIKTHKLQITQKPSSSAQKTTTDEHDLKKCKALADIQFGPDASKSLFGGKITINKSKKTKKIRTIYADNRHLLSLRATDGLYTLKIEGAKRLHTGQKPPSNRIIIDDDATPFVKEGKSVFAKFVIDCDENLRPYDECLIVDKKDTLLGVGRSLLSKNEMRAFNTGVAAKTREAIQ